MTEQLDTILSGGNAVAEKPTEAAPETETVTTEATPQEQPAGQKMVPHEALHAEKQKVKRYTEQIATFDETLRKQNTDWENRFNQLLERLPKEQPQPMEDWFADPDKAFRQRGEALVNPVVGVLKSVQSELAQIKAEKVFGEKYGEFLAYIKDANGRGDPEVKALEAAMDASHEPYVVAKKWFESKTFDPAAKEAEIEARVLAKYGIDPNAQPQQQPAPVMPSNFAGARNVGARSGPAWAGPTPIGDIFKR